MPSVYASVHTETEGERGKDRERERERDEKDGEQVWNYFFQQSPR